MYDSLHAQRLRAELNAIYRLATVRCQIDTKKSAIRVIRAGEIGTIDRGKSFQRTSRTKIATRSQRGDRRVLGIAINPS